MESSRHANHGSSRAVSATHTVTSPPQQHEAPMVPSSSSPPPLPVEGNATGGSAAWRQRGLQCFGDGRSSSQVGSQAPARQPQVAPTPPPSRWNGQGAMRNPRLSTEERSGPAAVHDALKTSGMPACLDALPKADTAALPKFISPPDSVLQVRRLPSRNVNGGSDDGVERCILLTSSTVEPPNSSRPTPPPPLSAAEAAGERAPLSSPGAPTAMLPPQQCPLAYMHGLSRESVLVATGTGPQRPAAHRYCRAHSDSSASGLAVSVKGSMDVSVGVAVANQQPPKPRPAAATQCTSVDRIVSTSVAETGVRASPPSTPQKSARLQSNMHFATVASCGPVKLMDQILEASMEGSDSPSRSFVESSLPGLEGELAPDVAEACHGFLHRLPKQWARSVVRAVTLQSATLQVPQRLLRAPVIFDAYSELRGEVAAMLEAASAPGAGKATASSPDRLRQSYSTPAMLLQPCSSVASNQSLSLLQGVDLQRLLTVAPALLRYRFRSARTAKAGELRAGFLANAQTATRTEASINRYAYLPHVQRDVHFGAMVAQGVMRMMSPGPRLLGCHPSHSCGDGVLPDVGQQHHLEALTVTSGAQRNQHSAPPPSRPVSVTSTSLASPAPTITYSTVSFQGLPSIFLKDRYDVAHSESVSSRFSSAAQGGAGDSSNFHHSSHRRRHTSPFFEREFVATLASGQEDAAFFTTTMAPEFMVGLPSFLKHPERAVPLSIAASLHHLYTAVSVEMFLRAYTAMAVKHAMEASSSGKGPGPAAAKAAGGQQVTTSPLWLLHTASPLGEIGDGTPSSLANVSDAHSSAMAALPPRGPALELGVVYVRNTIVCSASTPGMESYVILLHQIVYPTLQGGDSRSSSTSEQQGAASALPSSPPPPCRAVLQLSEEAKGSMAPPAMPASATASGHTPTSGTFGLPTIKHAAVELTQLVTWVQDERSHDSRHGQPFLCDLTFVSTYISAIAAPTPTSLCQPLPVTELEDASLFPCAVVLATLDMWRALPLPEVSNLLRICFILDRHAQRVMELESPDYVTEEMLMSAAGGQASATESGKSSGRGPVWSATCAIPFPDPQLRKHVSTAVAAEVRAYLEGLPTFDQGNVSQHVHQQQQRHQRLLAFFMARLHYYEDLNERHCKTEEALQHEVLQRMARQRASPTAPSPQPTCTSVSPSEPSTPAPPICDVYKAKTKSVCDALAAVLAVEAAISSRCTNRGRAEAAAAHGVLRMRTASQQSYCSVDEAPDTSGCGDDIAAVAAAATASIVVLLVPQRDVKRR